VQNDAIEDGELFGDLPDMLEAEIGRRLQRLEGADARLAFRVAPIRRLQVQGTGQPAHDGGTGRRSHDQRAETTVVQALPTFGRS